MIKFSKHDKLHWKMGVLTVRDCHLQKPPLTRVGEWGFRNISIEFGDTCEN